MRQCDLFFFRLGLPKKKRAGFQALAKALRRLPHNKRRIWEGDQGFVVSSLSLSMRPCPPIHLVGACKHRKTNTRIHQMDISREGSHKCRWYGRLVGVSDENEWTHEYVDGVVGYFFKPAGLLAVCAIQVLLLFDTHFLFGNKNCIPPIRCVCVRGWDCG